MNPERFLKTQCRGVSTIGPMLTKVGGRAEMRIFAAVAVGVVLTRNGRMQG